MGTTQLLALRYPDPGSAPDGPGGIYALALDAEASASGAVMRVGAQSDRLALTGTALFEERRVVQLTDKIEWLYRSGVWHPWNSDWATYNAGFNYSGGSGASGGIRWRYEDGLVHVQGKLVLGSSPSLNASSITFLLPKQADDTYGAALASRIVLIKNGVAGYQGAVTLSDTFTAQLSAFKTDGTYSQLFAASATVPFTWASGDSMQIDFTYTPAS